MNAQEILTSVIEGIFWLSVAFMIFQFITGLFMIEHKSYTVIQLQLTTVTPSSTAIALTNCAYEELPDPWTLESEVVECNSNQIVISSPPLKLLPGIKEIELQPKRTTSRSKKNNQPKSPKKTKTDKSTTARKPVSPRKKVA